MVTRSFRRRFGRAVVALAAAAAAAACSRSDAPDAGALRVEPSAIELPYGAFARVRLHWTMRRPLENLRSRALVFVHLIDRPNHVLRTFDYELPPGGWTPGTERVDERRIYQSLLGEPLRPGLYTLTAGLYDADFGYRWRLSVDGQEVARREYDVARVRIRGTRPAAELVFSGGWGPLQKGTDDRILGRRLVEGAAAIRASGAPGPLWLVVRLPDAWLTRATRPTANTFSAGGLRMEGAPLEAADMGGGSVSIDARASGDSALELRFDVAAGAPEPTPALEIAAWDAASLPPNRRGDVRDRPIGKIPPVEEPSQH